MKHKLVVFWLFFWVQNVEAISGEELKLWRQDINFLQQEIKKQHIAPFHQQTEQDFDASIHNLLQQLPALNEAQVEVRLMRIAAAIGDAHTGYNLMSGPHQHFPIRFQFFGDSLRVIATDAEHKDLLGAQLVGVEKLDFPSLKNQLTPYINYVENPYSLQYAFAFQLTIAKLLYGVGISADPSRATFTFLQQGKQKVVKLKAVSMSDFSAVQPDLPVKSPKIADLEPAVKGIQLGFMPQVQAAYLSFRHYPELAEMVDACPQIQRRIQQQQARNLIVDFRDNLGGDFYIGLALSSCLSSLDQLDWLKGIYVLINSGTQSAAMSNAAQFQQLLNATLVGMPTGADPNHFMETGRAVLPNSQRKFSYSKRYYRFVAAETDALYPDIRIEQSWQSYRSGEDEVLKKVVALLQQDKTLKP